MRWRFRMKVKTHEARASMLYRRMKMGMRVLVKANTKAKMISAMPTIPAATALGAHTQ